MHQARIGQLLREQHGVPYVKQEFKAKYRKELDGSKAFADLMGMVRTSDVTILYAAKDTEHNNAVALVEFLKEGGAS